MTQPSPFVFPDPALEAAKLLGRVSPSGPCVDLSKLVSLWPNLSIAEESLEEAGYLLPIGELGGTILVNKADKEERKRFTVAHELGHWLLGLAIKEATGRFSQPKDAPYTEIERWCDQFATNLLMPEPMIRVSIVQSDPVLVLDSLTRAASKFKVSEQAMFLRAWEVLRFQVALVTLSGAPGPNEAHLEKSFADGQAQAALENALSRPEIVNQLLIPPIIYFSLSSPKGKVRCCGRRLSVDRVLLALKWPVTDPAKDDVKGTEANALME
jgi:hypothetical protein